MTELTLEQQDQHRRGTAFLTELNKLMRKHQVSVQSCGCCYGVGLKFHPEDGNEVKGVDFDYEERYLCNEYDNPAFRQIGALTK